MNKKYVVKILKEIKSIIENLPYGERRFICFMIADVLAVRYLNCANYSQAADDLRNLIVSRLDRCSTVESWLHDHADMKDYKDMPLIQKNHVMMEYRLCWVKELIKEFSNSK